MRKAKFSIDLLGDQLFDGYTQGETWNGWACPYFTLEQAEQIMQAYRERGLSACYDKTLNAFTFQIETNEDELDTFPAIDIEGAKLFPIGAFCWIWEESLR